MDVQHWDPRRDGPLTEQAMGAKLSALGYRVNRYVYPPGTRFPAHTHDVDKIDAVLSGRFLLDLDGQRVVLEAGDWVEVSRGLPHSAEVLGAQPVVSLDAVRR